MPAASPLLLALSAGGAEGERDATPRLRQVVVDAVVQAGGAAYAPLPLGGLGPLHLAAMLGRDDVAERLLLSSAPVATADAAEPLAISRLTVMTRSSPLALACTNHQAAVGSRLLRATLDAPLKDESRTALLSTALLHAASAFALGQVLGAVAGSSLTARFGFARTTQGASAVMLVLAVLLLALSAGEAAREAKRKSSFYVGRVARKSRVTIRKSAARSAMRSTVIRA